MVTGLVTSLGLSSLGLFMTCIDYAYLGGICIVLFTSNMLDDCVRMHVVGMLLQGMENWLAYIMLLVALRKRYKKSLKYNAIADEEPEKELKIPELVL